MKAGADQDITQQVRQPKQLQEKALPQELPQGQRERKMMSAQAQLRQVGVQLVIVGMLMMAQVLKPISMRCRKDREHAEPLRCQFVEQAISEKHEMGAFVSKGGQTMLSRAHSENGQKRQRNGPYRSEEH